MDVVTTQIVLDAALLGFGAAILTELLKLFPALRANTFAKASTSLVVVALISWYATGWSWDWQTAFAVLTSAFINYKAIVGPVAIGLKSRTQA